MDQHDLVKRLKEMEGDLGRSPTRAEFTAKVPQYQLETLFGTFAALQEAAGISPYRKGKEKIGNEVFERDIEQHLADYKPKPYKPHGPYPTFASISDMHLPFVSHRVLKTFYEYVGDEKPEWVILNGDAWDMYSSSKFPRSHNIFTPRAERNMCLKMNAEFWETVKKLAPKTRCRQLMGNHDLRPLKRILEAVPSAEDWAHEMMKKDFTFPGVVTILDATEELYLSKDVIAFHGYLTKLGAHMDYTLLNCINGHTHRAGVVWKQIRNQPLFEANSGLAGDPMAKGLTYRPQKITTWTPGFLGGDKRGPKFISS